LPLNQEPIAAQPSQLPFNQEPIATQHRANRHTTQSQSPHNTEPIAAQPSDVPEYICEGDSDSLLLIDPYIVYFVIHGEGVVVDWAAVVAADGEVEEDVVRLLEGVFILTFCAVDSFGERGFVQ